MRPILIPFLLIFGVMFLGCSGSTSNSINTPDIPDGKNIEAPVEEGDNHRVLWGIWNLSFDQNEMAMVIEPVRNIEAHWDITEMIIPPACDDCFEVDVNSFDPVTRILDADVTLRNPYPIGGYDVRGILYSNDYGHLLKNADDWTKLFETPGGQSLNPFKAFAKNESQRKFTAGAEHTVNYLVYIPSPPNYWAITFAVTASWPGNCLEPFSIGNFNVDGHLYDFSTSYVDLSINVWDWQDDVNKVTFVATEISGQPFSQFTHGVGTIWEFQLVNAMEAPAGEYTCRVIATSENSNDTALYDYVTINIGSTGIPEITGMDPVSGEGGDTLTDVEISGANFAQPADVWLQYSNIEIHADDVVVIDPGLINCSLPLPLDTQYEDWDVYVQNGAGLTAYAPDLFEVLAPTAVVTGINPSEGVAGTLISAVEIYGNKFLPGDSQVWLKKAGEPDIEILDVEIINPSLIHCYIVLPSQAAPGLYDVAVHNNYLTWGIGEELFEITEAPPKNGWARNFGSANADRAYGVGTDNDYVYVTGYHDISYAFLRKYGIAGDLYWERIWGGETPVLVQPRGVVTDASGNVYVAGYFKEEVDFDPGIYTEFRTPVGLYDAFLLSLDGYGNYRFVLTWGNSANDTAEGIFCEGNQIFVTGSFVNTVDFDPSTGEHLKTSAGSLDAYLTQFDAGGSFINAVAWGGIDTDVGYDVIKTDTDLIYVVGDFKATADFNPGTGTYSRTSNGDYDAFVVELTQNMEFIYAYTWGGPEEDNAVAVTVSPSNYLYVAGVFRGTDVDFDPYSGEDLHTSNGFTDAYVNIFEAFTPYDHEGVLTWGGLSYDYAYGIDACGSGFSVAGTFGNSVDFDPDPGEEEVVSSDGTNIFLSRFDSSNVFQWVRNWGASGSEGSNTLVMDDSGNSYPAGYFGGNADFDPGPGEDWHSADGSSDAFVSKFPPDGNW